MQNKGNRQKEVKLLSIFKVLVNFEPIINNMSLNKYFYLIPLVGLLLVSSLSEAQNKKRRKKISAVIAKAETYKGTPYKYGGTSKSGIDCSALIQNSYAHAGYKVPRTSKEQSKFGKKVSWNGVRPGDLVFFKFKKKGEKWYHSGMVVRREGENIYFLHASSSRGVVESNLASDYYKKNVKVFRRVI